MTGRYLEQDYKEITETIETLLDKIKQGMENNAKDVPSWGYVGELEYAAAQLKVVSDLINQEGEYKND